MNKLLLLCYLQIFALSAFSQVTIFQDDFELSNSFNFSGDPAPNNWRINSCAGNGTSTAGINALYISQGGVDLDCSATGDYQYGYVNSPSGIKTTYASALINASCANNLTFSFDYKITTDNVTDFAELVYSTNGGASWVVLATLTTSASWSSVSGSLPALLNDTDFLFGVSFTYDDVATSGLPIAIDNVKIEGISTDITPPIMTCATNGVIEMNSSCEAVVGVIEKYVVTLSDNCTDSSDITYNYTPNYGTILPGIVGDFVIVDLIAIDASGNFSNSCSINLQLVDSTAPVITSCQTATTGYLNENCEYFVEDFTPFITATDNCSSSIVYSQQTAPLTVISGEQAISITLTATDESGNSSDCSFTLTTADTILPTIICPPTQTLYSNSSCQGSLLDYTSLAVYSDNCVSTGSLTVSQTPISGSIISSNQIVTLQVTGGIPSTPRECAFLVQLIDTVKPTLTCPITSITYTDNNCETLLQDYSSMILWSDNCESNFANMTVSQNPVSGSVISTNTNVVITLVDPSGNSNSCNFNVNVLDTISPTIICPSNSNQATNINCQADLNDYTSLAVGMDNCTSSGLLTYSQSPVLGSTISTPTTVTITVTDASSNLKSCQFVVTPIDTTAPTLTCPTTIQISSDANCEYVLQDESGIVTADDNCSSSTNLIITQNPIIGATIPSGTTNVLFTYEDEAGNVNSCSVAFEIIDLLPPTITTCPSSMSVYVDANCDAFLDDYLPAVVANDNCTLSNNLTITQSPVSGTQISNSQIVTITVTDAMSNSSQCAFNVNITDTISPLVFCPNDTVLAINSSCEYVTPDFGPNVTGTDNCSAFSAMTITQNPLYGTTQNGTTPVIITLTDGQGNSANCVLTISPLDTIVPQITCPTPATVNNGINCNYVLPYYGTLAPVIDNCSNYTITQNPPQGSSVEPGSNTIFLTVIDAVGNATACSFQLVVTESQAPTITCPVNIQSCDPIVTYVDPTFNDNCFAFISQTDNTGYTSGDTFPIGTTILEYTVADSSGNTDACTFFVEVLVAPNAHILQDTIAVCDVNSVLLEADPADGVWTVLSGQGNFNNQFAYQTGVNNINTGTSSFVWTVATAFCGVESDTVIVINSLAPSAANTQDTMLACSQNSINLFTSTPSSGTGTWTTFQGAIIASPNSSVTTATGLADGWNDFVWTISNIGCPSNSDTMRVLSSGNAQIFSNDTTFCYDNMPSVTLTGSNPGANYPVNWQFIIGSGSFSNSTSSTTTASNFQVGENVIVYTVDYNLCPADSDTILVVANICNDFEPVFPTVITPNADGKNDVFEIQNLEKIYPNCTITIFNRWGSVVFESVGYADPWNGTYNGEKLPMGTYFFKLELNDDQNQHFTGPISIIH